jgi:hypothetical protein
MLRALGRRAAPVSVAVPLLVGGLLAGTGGIAVPGGEGPTVLAVPQNGPLGASAGRDMEPEPDPERMGAHPVTFPSNGSVRARPAVARDPAPPPDFSDRALPAQVLAAYRMAASSLGRTDPGCRLGWPLLAAVGKVESGHAYGGAVDRRGDTLVPILGPVLDGGPGVAAIADTDDGRWDTDKTWDRAVGPMQFIPGSWVLHGQDGNGDGRRDPNNVMDAVLASAYYLCGGGGDLGVEKDRRAAVFSYNHSWDYVDLVLAWAEAYADGTPVLTGALLGFAPAGDSGRRGGRDRGKGDGRPAPAVPRGAMPTTTPVAPAVPPATAAPAPVAPPRATTSPEPSPGPKDEPTAGPREPAPTPAPTRTPEATPSPSDPPSDKPSDKPSDPPSDKPSDPPSDKPSDPPSPDPCPTPTDTPSPTESPTPSPSQVEATPTPSPSPTCGPAGSA